MQVFRHLVASILVTILAVGLAHPANAATARIVFVVVSDIYQMSEQRLADGMIRGCARSRRAVCRCLGAAGVRAGG